MPDKGPIRPWTNEEKEKLFNDYFKRLPGICAVCGREVRMMMEHEGEEPVLVMRCECGNRSRVRQGPS